MLTVRCKFKLDEVATRMSSRAKYEQQADGSMKHVGYEPGFLYDAKFSAVYGDRTKPQDSDNAKFWDATPSGSLVVSTIRQMPWQIGSEYYLDLTPAARAD